MDIGTLSFTGEPALPTGKPSSSPDSGATGENPYLPKPLEALQETPVPPFLTKTYELVDDPALDPTLSWGLKGDSFVVWNEVDFARTVLPQHFKHGNFSSFVRQLNTYVGILETEPNEGFRKVDSDRYEFANEDFLRGKKHLLKNIHRHKSTGHFLGSSIESRKAGFEFEVENLKHGRDILMQEVLNLQQQQHLLADQFTLMNQRLQIAEQKQKQMISFMIKSIRNPAFLTHLLHQKENQDLSSNKIKRKFLKQQSSPVSSMEEQIVRNITDLGSTVPSLVMPESSEIPEIGNFLLDNAKSSVEVKQEPVHLFDQKGYEVSSPRLLNSPDTFFNGKSVFEPIVKQEEKLSMDFDSGVRDYGSCSNWEDGLCSYEEQELVGDCGLYGFWDLQELEEVSQINLWESQVEDAKEDHPQSLQQLWVPF